MVINFFRFCSRPKCVDEVAFQEEVVAVLKKSVEGADVSKLAWNDNPNADLDSDIMSALISQKIILKCTVGII